MLSASSVQIFIDGELANRLILLPPTLPRVPPPQVDVVGDPLSLKQNKKRVWRNLHLGPHPHCPPPPPPPCWLLLAVLRLPGLSMAGCVHSAFELRTMVASLPWILTASHICLIKELLNVLATLNLKAILFPTLADDVPEDASRMHYFGGN